MILKQCCDALEKNNLTIAFIESASSGYLSSQFSIYKNSGADILLGGLISYDPSIKTSILHIPQNLITQFTAESAEVTQAMAKYGARLFNQANFVVACTGLLKPGGSATTEKPEGTFYISILFNQRFSNFHYFITGTPIERLNKLTELTSKEVLHLIQTTAQ